MHAAQLAGIQTEPSHQSVKHCCPTIYQTNCRSSVASKPANDINTGMLTCPLKAASSTGLVHCTCSSARSKCV